MSTFLEQGPPERSDRAPRGGAATPRADDRPSEPPGPGTDPSRLPRILLADDNGNVRSSVSRSLGTRYRVEGVADGEQALERVRAFPPDLVLCDIMMPGMTGFEVLHALQSDPGLRDIPVILLSARGDEDYKLKGLEGGAADYLTKPFTPSELRGRVSAHLRLARIRSEQARREAEARRRAEEANQAKARFLTTMSHELRTPLNAIAGYVEILALGIYGPVTEEQRQALRRIQESQRHVLSLMNDVLDFAKLEAGRTSFAPSDVSLHDALGALETMIAPQLIRKGVEYRLEPCAGSATLRVDVDRLRQVTLNLLSNAIKFTPPGGQIVLSCDCVTSPERAFVRVRDTGIGIPAEKLDTIFDPFVQIDPGQADDTAGTGLGLAISRDLAHAMGGTLDVESRQGEGATFTLAIPRRQPVSA